MLVDLKHRSQEKELMDSLSIAENELKIALTDISRVNTMLGGNSITINAIRKLIKKSSKNEFVILDLGCGDGEMLRNIAKSFRKQKRKVKLIGIDLNGQSLEYAKELSVNFPEITFYKQDILEVDKEKFGCDIIVCTLTLHHLTCEEIKKVLLKSVKLASIGIVINDLQRSALAYYLFRLFSFFFIKGYIAKNDGLVSIKRGFTKRELIGYATTIKLKKYHIDWKWAFRYRWIIKTNHTSNKK
ncbi:methyltransferase domain-containing protein [Aquimarina gracilis]|uniref:Methyltransferase domain-containing protein n=1 Tax=Aquimarina gracilis TaxID=874422 RepID=A0ABU5ZX34_9FLAO|nr:methyltransferase domain-containing protein [Aquimarina gracilis]MEB3346402.1 methyltransferase domain-containing protein [Aquimarina gracilis]